MAITRDELIHVARIARIELSEEEIEELLPQFNEILQLFERVKTLPLTDEAKIITTDNRNEFREDAVIPFENPDDIVSQFPRKTGRLARVPRNL
jgi:aspartyl-tRNA(Asn)/glutamyl-tRNA(Gln) amidotransferase subunit C